MTTKLDADPAHTSFHDNNGSAADLQDPRLVAALEEYMQAVERRQAPDRAEFLDRHAGIAGSLALCLDGLMALQTPRASDPGAGQPPSVTDLQAELPLGDYRLVAEIGRGGMGVVYEAEQLSLGRRVALKVLPFAATLDGRQLQRFQNEARAAACLHHANIVPVHGVGCERGVHYYAMQLIDGQSLESLLKEMRRAQSGHHAPRDDAAKGSHDAPRDDAVLTGTDEASSVGPAGNHAESDGYLGNPETVREPRAQASTLPSPREGAAYFRRIAELMIQAAEALEHAHQSGVVHRDIKPGNLMLDGRGNLWVTDFGLAQFNSDARLTLTGDLVGTLRYMSPEQALAKRVIVDHRTDIYSLGATLYELLTLNPAFLGQDRQELLRQIAFEEPVAPRRLNRTIPVELETIMAKAMEKNPADRYATAKEMADDLKRYLNDEPTLARRPSLWQRGRKWARRHVAVVRAAAVVMMALAMVLGIAGVWLRDQAVRAAETERVVNELLNESDRLQTERKTPEALAKVKQAKEMLASGSGTEALTEQVKTRWDDLKMAWDLEEIRAQRTTAADKVQDGVSNAQVISMYRVKFREFGIDVQELPPDEAVRRIRRRTVPVELAAALDDWSAVVKSTKPPEDTPWKKLLAIARQADPDPLRSRLREALEQDKGQDLMQLASSMTASKEAEQLSAATVATFALALEACGAFNEEVRLLTQSQRTHNTDFWINFLLAGACEKCQPPLLQESLRFYTAALVLRPQSAMVHFRLGMVFTNQGRRENALAAFEVALRLKPDFAAARNSIRVQGSVLRRIDQALVHYVDAINSDPVSMAGYQSLILFLDKRGDAEKVLTDLQKCFSSGKALALALNTYGELLERRGLLEKALEVIQHGANRNPISAVAQEKLGDAHFRRGQWDKAITAYQKCMDRAQDHVPSYPGPRTLLGYALYTTKRFDEAHKAFEAAVRFYEERIKADPTVPGLHSQLSFLLVSCPDSNIRDPGRALAEAKIGLDLEKARWWGPLGTLGASHYRNNQLEDARTVLQEALKTRGRDGYNEFFFLAMTEWKLGEKELARHTFKQGLAQMVFLQKIEHGAAYQQAVFLRAEAAKLLGLEGLDPPSEDAPVTKK